MSSSSDEDDNFLRLHAKAIAEALQKREASEQAVATGTSSASKTQRDRMVHDTYIALCHDDPQVESELACQYLAAALVDPTSPYALSGPLVEGIRQLCSREESKSVATEKPGQGDAPSRKEKENDTTTNAFSTNVASSSTKGSAMLAWAVYARIPLLCCQATDLSEVHSFLGSYRPPPPPTPLAPEKEKNSEHIEQQNEDADRLAAMLSQPREDKSVVSPTTDNNDSNADGLDNEVWAAESDPSDFEFESGFSYEQQMEDFQNTFSEWLIDRNEPLKLSKSHDNMTWKQVRHAVMDLTAQLTYRQVAPLWTAVKEASVLGNRTPADLLTQFTMTLLVPLSSKTECQGPSLHDSPDDEEDALQPQRQLQAMAWYPLWVLRDAAAAMPMQSSFSHYLTLLQTLISVDAASRETQQANDPSSMAPAMYVGLASLSSLCQQFVVDTEGNPKSNSSQTLEQFRQLRITLFELSDDLSHALEQEGRFQQVSAVKSSQRSTEDRGAEWIVWTLLPLWEILCNQRLQNGTVIVAKVESAAQKYHQQTGQQWSALLQSGLLRHWLARLQLLFPGRLNESSPDNSLEARHALEQQLQFRLVRRSVLFMVAQSMAVTSALGKYTWRFPNLVNLVEIGHSFQRTSSITPNSGTLEQDAIDSFAVEDSVDDILWNLLAAELAAINANVATPALQLRSTTKNNGSSATKPLPSREECLQVSSRSFGRLCRQVVQVIESACQEENKKENEQSSVDPTATTAKTKPTGTASSGDSDHRSRERQQQQRQQLVLQNFHRFVNSLVACPLLAKVFVHDMSTAFSLETAESGGVGAGGGSSGGTNGIEKCLEAIQDQLSQYKPPVRIQNGSEQDVGDDGNDSRQQKSAKEHSIDASLQEDIHLVRKLLKMLRTLLSSSESSASGSIAMMSQSVTSSSKTD